MEALLSKKSASFTATAALTCALLLACALPGPAYAATCADVQASLQPCVTSLAVLPTAAPAACCLGLKAIAGFEGDIGVSGTCKCAKSFLTSPLGVSVSVNVSLGVQGLCGVNLGFNLASDIACA
ncbi:Non-specific lipid-transfer protein 4.1 [Acorus calamus]|uniref:Non-specific lipid-transfer protein 4.1 n=1 Tax=Acorus calamus TaxID=4465 RepID=A0AAV9CYR5_ACOCL|nr:Non-specific lipid-transfer protein 4.1 [Acorus calamus]